MIQQAIDELNVVRDTVDTLEQEEEEAYYNLPDGLQMSERGSRMEDAYSHLQDAVSSIEDAISPLESAAE